MGKRFKNLLFWEPEDEEYEMAIANDITMLLDYMKRNLYEMSLSDLSSHIICMCDMVSNLQVCCSNNCDAAVEWNKEWYKKCQDELMNSRVILC